MHFSFWKAFMVIAKLPLLIFWFWVNKNSMASLRLCYECFTLCSFNQIECTALFFCQDAFWSPKMMSYSLSQWKDIFLLRQGIPMTQANAQPVILIILPSKGQEGVRLIPWDVPSYPQARCIRWFRAGFGVELETTRERTQGQANSATCAGSWMNRFLRQFILFWRLLSFAFVIFLF